MSIRTSLKYLLLRSIFPNNDRIIIDFRYFDLNGIIFPMNILLIGQLIQARREELGIRQGDLAELAGLTTKSVYLLEHGKANPSFSTMSRIFEVLGLEWVIKVKTMEP